MNQPGGCEWLKTAVIQAHIYYCKAWCSHWKTPGDNSWHRNKSSAAESTPPRGRSFDRHLWSSNAFFFRMLIPLCQKDLLPCKRKLASVLNDRQTWVCCLWKPLHWMCHKTSEQGKTMEKLYINNQSSIRGPTM